MGKVAGCDTKLQMLRKFPENADSGPHKPKIELKSFGAREIQWKDAQRPWLSRFAMR
jgi:hypothetical protein